MTLHSVNPNPQQGQSKKATIKLSPLWRLSSQGSPVPKQVVRAQRNVFRAEIRTSEPKVVQERDSRPGKVVGSSMEDRYRACRRLVKGFALAGRLRAATEAYEFQYFALKLHLDISDARLPLHPSRYCAPARLSKNYRLICPTWQETYFAPLKIFRLTRHPNQTYNSRHPVPRRGALAIVTNVGAGCGGRGSVGRERCSQGGSSVSGRIAQTDGA